MEILDLFLALVVVGVAKYFLDVPTLLPFALAVINALVLYTLSKVYLTGYWVRSKALSAGLTAFIVFLVGVTWI